MKLFTTTFLALAAIPSYISCLAAPQSALRGGDVKSPEEAAELVLFEEEEPHVVEYQQADRNLAVTCPAYSASKQTDSAFGTSKVTKDCPTNYRMVAYKCYNYNDDYDFNKGQSEVRYTKINGVEYLKGVTCKFEPDWPGAGGR